MAATPVHEIDYDQVGTINASNLCGFTTAATGNLYTRRVGPYRTAWTNGTAPGWGCDVRQVTSNHFNGVISLSSGPAAAAQTKGFWGWWIFIKSFGQNPYIINLRNTSNARTLVFEKQAAANLIDFRGAVGTTIIPTLNQWQYYRMAWASGSWRAYQKLPGGVLTTLYSGTYTGTPGSLNFNPAPQSGVTGPQMRIAFDRVYSIDALDDADVDDGSLLEPPTTPAIYGVDAINGDDSNDGIVTPTYSGRTIVGFEGNPWKTASKLKAELTDTGVMGSHLPAVFTATGLDATGETPAALRAGLRDGSIRSNGDTVCIKGTLTTDVGLTVSSPGVRLTGCENGTLLALKPVTTWTQTPATTRTWESTDTVAQCVLLKNRVALAHPSGANYAAVAATLDAAAGKFWTDGTKMYLSSDTDPTSDGNTYERTYATTVLTLTSGHELDNLTILGGMTVTTTNGVVTNYTVNVNVDAQQVYQHNVTAKFGSDHTWGNIGNGSTVIGTVDNCDFRDSAPYYNATSMVLFNGSTTATGNDWEFKGCSSDYWLCHATSTGGPQFASIAHDNCTFNTIQFSQGTGPVTSSFSVTPPSTSASVVSTGRMMISQA